mmetsp:Transcript_62199/g.110215  ORF Transcript_62199/g.110215 Transcript_62199/m.110215 type:complete len:192 (+) Transcript_62199:618-1193(+)
MGGMVVMMHLCLDFKSIVLGKHHFLLYVLACCIRPRMLVTLDEELKPLPVTVRVGTAVDVVGLAGRPKKITGFQTHTTPVLLASGERAELATDEYIPLTSILEGVVVLRKNPDSIEASTSQMRRLRLPRRRSQRQDRELEVHTLPLAASNFCRVEKADLKKQLQRCAAFAWKAIGGRHFSLPSMNESLHVL